VGNRLISRKSIGDETEREKGLERLQKISARGAHCGDKPAWPETVTQL
jgi:hypothetical protein